MSFTSSATNPLANSERSPMAPFVAFTPHGEVQYRRKAEFALDDNSSTARKISATRDSSSSSDPPISWSKDYRATESLTGLLSALYALVLVLFSLTIELSMVLQSKRYVVMPWLYECFHIYLYGAALAFFTYCYGFMLNRGWIRGVRSREASFRTRFSRKSLNESQSEPANFSADRRRSLTTISHSGPTAGSLYLRLGCVVFGIVCVVSIGMQLYECIEIDYNSGDRPSKCGNLRIIKLCIAIMFTFMQMHFIFKNSKVTIHRSKNISRFGTMHLIAVNLWVWARTLILEEFEVSREIDHAQHENAHSLFVPFSNINSTATKHELSKEHSKHGTHQELKKDKDDILSLVMGCANEETCFMRQTFGPIMLTCTIEYALIAACVMFILWRNIGMPALEQHKSRKNNLRVDCSSSTTGMFIGLIFLVGTFISMIVFYSTSGVDRDADALWVFSLTHIVLYSASITACLIGVWRMRHMSYDKERHATGAKLLEDILLIVGLIGQLLFSISGMVGLVSASKRDHVSGALYGVLSAHIVRLLQVLLQTVFILGTSRMVASTPTLQRTKPGREIITFLMVLNIALFLVNTFEGQKASANRALVEFYGMEAWALIVQSTMPLSIFYRFHSSVCLAETWKHSYRVHERPSAI